MKSFETIIGQSPALDSLIRSAKIVAATDVTVLLKGNTGTGKEVFAHAIKNASPRADKEFLTLNCAALPESLIESELFGHKKGSFTGATHNTQGLLQAAHGGTLFLDEINSLPLSIQAKLLRFLDMGECLAVGDVRPYKVDVRVIAATNANLMTLIETGAFRSDLYFRLNVVPLELPCLADRSEDIELLITHFFALFEKNHGSKSPKFSKASLKILKNYKWSGNIRELRNLCERLSILFSNQVIEPEHLPPEFQTETNYAELPDFVL
ncbi:MAG: sigma-54-dependent Fis family transcriptional regulator, partial [Methylococcaceae bacterium]|nr:sigma-54-dependent Fis family transcriptional regulator [Methylococcaceae bacterium]